MGGGACLESFDARSVLEAYHDWEVLVEYVGAIDSSLITRTLEEMDTRLEALFPSAYMKKVYSVLIEILQNLYHHADYYPPDYCDEEHGENTFGVFKIGVAGGECHVLTGNFVSFEQMEQLRYRIDELNQMDSDQIRVRYKAILNNRTFSPKGGGGLGLVDMLRRAQHSLKYAFVQLAEDYYFYTLVVSVKN